MTTQIGSAPPAASPSPLPAAIPNPAAPGTTYVPAVPTQGTQQPQQPQQPPAGGAPSAPRSITPFDQQFAQAGISNNLDPDLLAAVGMTESSFNPNATSSTGARGVMQLEPGTASDLGVQDSTNPTQNINGGAAYLNQQISKLGVINGIKAYTMGPNGDLNAPAANAYLNKVYANYQQIKRAGGIQMAGQQTAANGASDAPLTGSAPQSGGAPPSGSAPGANWQNMSDDQLLGATTGGASSTSTPPPSVGAGQPGSPSGATGNSGQNWQQMSDDQLLSGVAAGGSQPVAQPQQAADGTQSKPGFIGNLEAGAAHALSPSGPLFGTLNNMTAWGDKNIPGAQQVDNAFGGPSAAQNAQITSNVAQGQQAFQQGAGSTIGGKIGNEGVTAALTVPLGGAVTRGVGAVLSGAADVAGPTSAVGRLLMGGKTLATGSGATTTAGKVASSITTGAAQGAIDNTAAGGTPLQGAAYGAAGGAIAPAVGSLLGRGAALLGTGGSRVLDSLGAPGATAGDATPITSALAGQKIPTGPIKIPTVTTQGGANRVADKIIAQYAKGGPTATDATELIPGSLPTTAQATGNPGLATLERSVQSANPTPFAMRSTGNGAVRQQVISGLTGTPGDIDAATAERDAITSQARDAAFADAKPVDAQPVVDQVQQLIAQNAGRPTVQGPLQQVLKQLEITVPDPTVDPATGVPTPGATMQQAVSDPQTLYNVRKYIGDIVSPKVAGTAQDGRAAAAQLMTLKPVLDDTIESGAPGYKSYIQQFDQLSQPINGMQALQKLNLYDAQGNVTLAKLDNAVKSLTSQQNAPGYKLADSVTPEQMQQLTALRDDMRREGLSNLGRPIGSNTYQNSVTGSMLNAAGHTGGHLVGTLIGAGGGFEAAGPMGAMVGPVIGNIGAHLAGKVAARSQGMVNDAIIQRLLNPQLAARGLQKAARANVP